MVPLTGQLFSRFTMSPLNKQQTRSRNRRLILKSVRVRHVQASSILAGFLLDLHILHWLADGDRMDRRRLRLHRCRMDDSVTESFYDFALI